MLPDHHALYNAQGTATIRSAIQVIDDAVAVAAGRRCSEVAMCVMRDLIFDIWATVRMGSDINGLHVPLTDAVCAAISTHTGRDLYDEVGQAVLTEINRVLKNLITGAMELRREELIALGADPVDPRLRPNS